MVPIADIVARARRIVDKIGADFRMWDLVTLCGAQRPVRLVSADGPDRFCSASPSMSEAESIAFSFAARSPIDSFPRNCLSGRRSLRRAILTHLFRSVALQSLDRRLPLL